MSKSDAFSGREVVRLSWVAVSLVLGALFSALTPLGAEETGKKFKLGTLNPGTPVPRFTQAEMGALRDLGYTEGRNLQFIERWAGGSEAQLQRDAVELVKLKVDVILAGSSAGARAAADATKTIPIVAIDLESDPVANGWVATIARPGGNVTGCFLDLPELAGKRLEQLREVVPHLSRVAILWDSSLNRTPLTATRFSAKALGLRTITLEVRRPSDLDHAFTAAVDQRAQAVLMWGSPMFDANVPKIAELAAQRRLPIAGFFPFHSESGFLLSYGPDVEDMTRRCMAYTNRIFRGEKPGDLPVQLPDKFYLVLNLKTANTLGVRFPQALLLQADRIIK